MVDVAPFHSAESAAAALPLSPASYTVGDSPSPDRSLSLALLPPSTFHSPSIVHSPSMPTANDASGGSGSSGISPPRSILKRRRELSTPAAAEETFCSPPIAAAAAAVGGSGASTATPGSSGRRSIRLVVPKKRSLLPNLIGLEPEPRLSSSQPAPTTSPPVDPRSPDFDIFELEPLCEAPKSLSAPEPEYFTGTAPARSTLARNQRQIAAAAAAAAQAAMRHTQTALSKIQTQRHFRSGSSYHTHLQPAGKARPAAMLASKRASAPPPTSFLLNSRMLNARAGFAPPPLMQPTTMGRWVSKKEVQLLSQLAAANKERARQENDEAQERREELRDEYLQSKESTLVRSVHATHSSPPPATSCRGQTPSPLPEEVLGGQHPNEAPKKQPANEVSFASPTGRTTGAAEMLSPSSSSSSDEDEEEGEEEMEMEAQHPAGDVKPTADCAQSDAPMIDVPPTENEMATSMGESFPHTPAKADLSLSPRGVSPAMLHAPKKKRVHAPAAALASSPGSSTISSILSSPPRASAHANVRRSLLTSMAEVEAGSSAEETPPVALPTERAQQAGLSPVQALLQSMQQDCADAILHNGRVYVPFHAALPTAAAAASSAAAPAPGSVVPPPAGASFDVSSPSVNVARAYQSLAMSVSPMKLAKACVAHSPHRTMKIAIHTPLAVAATAAVHPFANAAAIAMAPVTVEQQAPGSSTHMEEAAVAAAEEEAEISIPESPQAPDDPMGVDSAVILTPPAVDKQLVAPTAPHRKPIVVGSLTPIRSEPKPSLVARYETVFSSTIQPDETRPAEVPIAAPGLEAALQAAAAASSAPTANSAECVPVSRQKKKKPLMLRCLTDSLSVHEQVTRKTRKPPPPPTSDAPVESTSASPAASAPSKLDDPLAASGAPPKKRGRPAKKRPAPEVATPSKEGAHEAAAGGTASSSVESPPAKRAKANRTERDPSEYRTTSRRRVPLVASPVAASAASVASSVGSPRPVTGYRAVIEMVRNAGIPNFVHGLSDALSLNEQVDTRERTTRRTS